MIESCVWSDPFIELQMWTRLTYMAFDTKQHPLVVRCSAQALKFAVSGSQSVSKVKSDRLVSKVNNDRTVAKSTMTGQGPLSEQKSPKEAVW